MNSPNFPQISNYSGELELSQQYRALALELPGRFFEICAEPRRILGALKEGDKEKAKNYAREHYFNTAEKIAKTFESKVEA